MNPSFAQLKAHGEHWGRNKQFYFFQNLWLLPDKLIDNVGQVGDDKEGDHSQGEIRRFLRSSVWNITHSCFKILKTALLVSVLPNIFFPLISIPSITLEQNSNSLVLSFSQ